MNFVPLKLAVRKQNYVPNLLILTFKRLIAVFKIKTRKNRRKGRSPCRRRITDASSKIRLNQFLSAPSLLILFPRQ